MKKVFLTLMLSLCFLVSPLMASAVDVSPGYDLVQYDEAVANSTELIDSSDALTMTIDNFPDDSQHSASCSNCNRTYVAGVSLDLRRMYGSI